VKISAFIERQETLDATARRVGELERAGLDMLWVNESYRLDVISLIGYLAARTERIEIATGIVNVFSRTPALLAMTAAGCDFVSGGRFSLGIGASGPQVIEGFHGVPYDRPLTRMREYIDICRMVWRREPLVYKGRVINVPLPEDQGGTGLGKPLKLIETPVRDRIPIWWASLKGRSVAATAEVADGWLPTMFVPEKARRVWGDDLDRGLAKRSVDLAPLEIAAGGILRIGEDLVGDRQAEVLDERREHMALYVGGLGARDQNFYNDLACAYGYEREAGLIQNLYLSGKKKEAEAEVPLEWLQTANLVGPRGFIAERLAAYREAGVTQIIVNPVGGDALTQIGQLRTIIDSR
jgi:F420-dependent oxidoreductase-like protein